MTKNKEKFLKLVSEQDTKTKFRIDNRYWLNISQSIAIKTLLAMEDLNMSDVELSEKMNISVSDIKKILRGKENLTLDIIAKLETILGIKIINI
jgi:ribosome-binding protein aMBF1 (putative translation factor)